MDDRAPTDPGEAERSFAARLEEAGLPPFVSAVHDPALDLLEISWEHGVTLYMDLTRKDIAGPIDDEDRAVILGLAPCCEDCAPIDVYVPGSADEPVVVGALDEYLLRAQGVRPTLRRNRVRLRPHPAMIRCAAPSRWYVSTPRRSSVSSGRSCAAASSATRPS